MAQEVESTFREADSVIGSSFLEEVVGMIGH